MSNELPNGWVECGMGDVAKVVGGGTPDSQDPEHFSAESGIPWLTPADLSGNKAIHVVHGKRFLTKKGFDNSSARLVPKGTVLFSSRAPIGYVAVAANELSTNQGFKSFVCADCICSEYVYFWLRFATPMAEELASGTTFAEISGKNAAKIPLRLAPLPEQRRIVAKLENLLGQVDACQQRLAKIPTLLKRFRQSAIAAACSGRLTADWREENPSDYTTEDDELPRGWRRTNVENLIPKGGIFDGPFGSNLKSDDYTDSGVRVVRLENIGQLRFIGEKETFISREKYETLKKHTVGEGDIIFASFISEEVRACVLPKLLTKAIAKADCFCLRPKLDMVDRQYLVFQLISQKSYNALAEEVHGATRPRINTTQLRKLEVRVCPLPEQHEIVRRVESLFTLADQIESRLAVAHRQVDALTPSLLARAFAGKLVPQDPNDEPASALLERIRSSATP